jgi:hypothetical protein
LASGQLELKTFQWAAQPFNAAHYLRDATTGHRHLRVMTDARVIELRERGERRFDRVRDCRDVGRFTDACRRGCLRGRGGRHRDTATIARLECGSSAGHRQRLRSGGALSRDASQGQHGDARARAIPVQPHALFSDDVASGRVVRCGLGFTAGAQHAHRLLNHYVQVLPFFEHRANRLFETFRGTRRFDSPLIQRPPLIDGYAHGAAHIARDMFRRVRGTPRHTRKFVLRAFLDQYPNPANRVTLSDATDGQGMRLANLAWSFSPPIARR